MHQAGGLPGPRATLLVARPSCAPASLPSAPQAVHPASFTVAPIPCPGQGQGQAPRPGSPSCGSGGTTHPAPVWTAAWGAPLSAPRPGPRRAARGLGSEALGSGSAFPPTNSSSPTPSSSLYLTEPQFQHLSTNHPFLQEEVRGGMRARCLLPRRAICLASENAHWAPSISGSHHPAACLFSPHAQRSRVTPAPSTFVHSTSHHKAV